MLQLLQGRSEVENQYSRVVPWDGNLVALKAIGETMELRPYFEWRGLGFMSHSALQVRKKYAAMDAERLFQVPGPSTRIAVRIVAVTEAPARGRPRCARPSR